MKNLEKYLNYEFNTKEEYETFEKMFLGYIKKQTRAIGLEMVKYSRGYYECSCFIKNPSNNKYCYISITDVRYFKNEWYEQILYRTAQNETDYTGGHNNFCSLPELIKEIRKEVE